MGIIRSLDRRDSFESRNTGILVRRRRLGKTIGYSPILQGCRTMVACSPEHPSAPVAGLQERGEGIAPGGIQIRWHRWKMTRIRPARDSVGIFFNGLSLKKDLRIRVSAAIIGTL